MSALQRSQSIDADHRVSGDVPTADIEHKPLGALSDRFVGAELPSVVPDFVKDDFRGSELTQSTHTKHRSRRTTLSLSRPASVANGRATLHSNRKRSKDLPSRG